MGRTVHQGTHARQKNLLGLYLWHNMKKICVVSNVIGNRDVIHNGENGFVCAQVEEFARVIKQCRNGKDSLVEQAYQDILDDYNTKVMAEQYSNIYRNSVLL